MVKQLNGLCYEVEGDMSSKENLVFVHGSGCNRKFLKALASKLKQYKCYRIDLPDHGKSEIIGCTKVEDYIEAVSEFVSQLDNVTLIGHSLGGTICLGVAAKNLSNVKRSVIISSGAVFDKLDEKIHKMVQNQKVNWIYLLECLGSLWHPLVIMDCLRFESPSIILQDFQIDIELDIFDKISAIKHPVLLMVGCDDILTLPEYSHRIKQVVDDARLLLVPNVRHMLPIAKRKIVSERISEFITEK